MIYAKEKEKPKDIVRVHYDVEEYIYGRIDFVTSCPFGEMGRYTLDVNKVGDLGCNTCKWQVSNDAREHEVKCSHPKVEESKKPLFKKL